MTATLQRIQSYLFVFAFHKWARQHRVQHITAAAQNNLVAENKSVVHLENDVGISLLVEEEFSQSIGSLG